jgi:hypothetical protein
LTAIFDRTNYRLRLTPEHEGHMIGKIPLATSRTFPLQVMQADGYTPSTAFLASDVLTAAVWPGDDMPTIAMPAARWTDATIAAYQVAFGPTDLIPPLLPGIYRIRVRATRGPDTVEIFRDSLEVVVTEGAGVATAAYCTYEDMATECNWIKQFQDDEEDQTGFLEQRVKARNWMDGLILYAAPVTGPGSLISRQTWWSWSYSGVDPRNGTGLAVDQVLAGYLASGCLMRATPQGSRIVTATACYSLALVLRAQLGLSSEQAKFAGYMMRRAHAEASSTVVEIDINADGKPEYAFSLGTTNSRQC